MAEILAIIPARSGSKSVKDKNIRPIAGKPLLAWSIEQAKASKLVARVLVSTDSPAYAEIARHYGAETPFLRPASISGDHATDLEVFQHTLQWLKINEGYSPDICLHLRPTSPIRRIDDIDAVLNLLIKNPSLDSVRSISPSPMTPFKMWFRNHEAMLMPVIENGPHEAYNMPRQQLEKTFIQNACIDAVRSGVILDKHSMSGSRIAGYLMKNFHDIDTEEDMHRVASILFREDRNKPRTFCFDIDGVVASITPGNQYDLATPLKETVSLINRLYDKGHTILLFTARGTMTGINWEDVTRQQMQDWGVRYHELRFGKPAADYYIDDKMLSFSELRAICE